MIMTLIIFGILVAGWLLGMTTMALLVMARGNSNEDESKADLLNEAMELLDYVGKVHHGTIVPSEIHNPGMIDREACEADTCRHIEAMKNKYRQITGIHFWPVP